ncbi:NUMOD4 motif-containing HNH endonuclease [uncultured Staphylococcus sp.]|uniref:NUMOD4 motif-containing HNH endonuclease n=1 Tax=uncultured Staphylococcus sp. TaxID=189668 RepID=UPI0025DFA0C7|nr:NUMOD4 motif-containing HNH endonuclease [uncultured Staphylococcus sp.]
MNEVWKDIPGYEGIYEVSNHGCVRTHKNKTTFTKRHGIRHWKQRLLKEKNPNGRDVRVSLWKDGKAKDFLVHRLVALAFIPTVEGKSCINHIDGNPRNNNVDNLEWCDHKENTNHAFENNLMTTNMKVKLIHEALRIEYEFISLTRGGKFLGRSHSYLSDCIKKGRRIVTDTKGTRYIVEML